MILPCIHNNAWVIGFVILRKSNADFSMNPSLNPQTVYAKSLDIQAMGRAISLLFAGTREGRRRQPLGLRAQIAQALGTDVELIRENVELAAASPSILMRKQNVRFAGILVRNIISYCNGLEHEGVKEREYVQLLKREIEQFGRVLGRWRRNLNAE